MGMVKNVLGTAAKWPGKMPGASTVGGIVGRVPGGKDLPGVKSIVPGPNGGGTGPAAAAGLAQGGLAPYPAARQGYADMLGIKNFTPMAPAPAVAMPGVTTPASPSVTPPHVFNFINRLSWRGKAPRATMGYGQSGNWLDRWEQNQSPSLAKKMGQFGG